MWLSHFLYYKYSKSGKAFAGDSDKNKICKRKRGNLLWHFRLHGQ